MARARRRAFATALIIGASVSLGGCFEAPLEPDTGDVTDVAAEIDADLDAFLAGGDDAGRVRAVLIFHQGQPVLERYLGADPDDYWDAQSVTQSVMSALIGIAIDRGLIPGVEATLGELLPSYRVEMTPGVAAITLGDLLTQTANFPAPGSVAETFWSSPDWVGSIIAQRAASGAGDRDFHYSNAGPHLLSAILSQATGRSTLEFAREYLFEPLGIDSYPATEIVLGGAPEDAHGGIRAFDDADFSWPVDPQGVNVGASLLKLRPRDLAALGLAYLAGGRSPRGTQVIPEEWVQASTTARIEPAEGETGYGYLWWTNEAHWSPAYSGTGWGGQLIEVVPDRELVVVIATEYDQLDPKRDLRRVSPAALEAFVSTWVAPRFAPERAHG